MVWLSGPERGSTLKESRDCPQSEAIEFDLSRPSIRLGVLTPYQKLRIRRIRVNVADPQRLDFPRKTSRVRGHNCGHQRRLPVGVAHSLLHKSQEVFHVHGSTAALTRDWQGSLERLLQGKRLPKTPTVRTGGDGLHLYFQLSEDFEPKSRSGIMRGLDIKVDGGFVVAPPSKHHSGNRYLWRWGQTPSKVDLAAVPDWLSGLLSKAQSGGVVGDTTRPTRSDQVQQVLVKLDNVRPNANRWTALCPAHGDRNNSLSVAEGDDGKVLLKCFAGCDVAEIVAALGLQMFELFPAMQTKILGKE